MSFIKVTADQCNSQGLTSPKIPRSEFHLNIDLIGAVRGDTILLKGGNILSIGGDFYTNFRLANGQKIPN